MTTTQDDLTPEKSKWPRGVKFADDEIYHVWDQDNGVPTLGTVAQAIQIWSVFQNRPNVTVREAGEAFNLDDAQVREAVIYHPWMYLAGPDDDATQQHIEHDGE